MIGHATHKFAIRLPARRAKALRSGAKIDDEGLDSALALFTFQCSANFRASLIERQLLRRFGIGQLHNMEPEPHANRRADLSDV
jgi:hypothetical protein